MKNQCAVVYTVHVWHFSIECIVFFDRAIYGLLLNHFVIFIMLTCESNHYGQLMQLVFYNQIAGKKKWLYCSEERAELFLFNL